jgi:uncharacterized MAPEG superfamily protein
MESYTLDLYPSYGQIHLALFKNVTNTLELKQRLLDQDTTLAAAFVDARLVFYAECYFADVAF